MRRFRHRRLFGDAIRAKKETHRHGNPDKHGVAPHGYGFNHRPTFADARIAQGSPKHHGYADAVHVHQPNGRA